MDEYKKKKIFKIIILIFILVILLILLYLINKYLNNDYKNIDFDEEIMTNIVINDLNDVISNKKIIDKLKEKYNNEDIVGLLKLENANFSIPVVQSSDNDYYTNHNLYGNRSIAGAVFLDYRVDIDSSKKLIIFGHGSSNIKAPFNVLEEFDDRDFYERNKIVELTTSTTRKVYEVFSVYVETIDFSYMNLDFDNEEDYLNHLEKLKYRSIYDSDVELSSNDEILILQTCSTNKAYRNYQKKYLLIILRRVLNEEI